MLEVHGDPGHPVEVLGGREEADPDAEEALVVEVLGDDGPSSLLLLLVLLFLASWCGVAKRLEIEFIERESQTWR